MEALTNQEIGAFVASHPAWAYDEDAQELTRTATFGSYEETIAFANRVADLAEEQDHHPRLVIEYGKVTVAMNTHDAGDVVTERDIQLARAIDEL